MTVAATQRCLIDRDPVDPEDYDRFGSSVALSGNGRTLVAGAVNGPEAVHHVYTYDWDDGDEEWVIRPVKYYNSQNPGSTIVTVEWLVPDGWANDEYDDSLFGCSVALSSDGSMLAAGAWGYGDGSALIFDWDSEYGSWVQRGDILTGAARSAYGLSVALSGDGSILAVGAPLWTGSETNQGGVYIYDWDDGDEEWVQRGDVIVASDAAEADQFGQSVAFSYGGSTLVIGAAYRDGSGTSQGGVYVYDWDEVEEEWVQRGDVLVAGDAANYDLFGSSVALSSAGAILAVGAYQWEGTATNQGGVYVYDWDEVEEEWVQRGDVLVAGDAAEADRFGESVAMSQYGTVIAVGAPRWETTAVDDGVVYVFDAVTDLHVVVPVATLGITAGIPAIVVPVPVDIGFPAPAALDMGFGSTPVVLTGINQWIDADAAQIASWPSPSLVTIGTDLSIQFTAAQMHITPNTGYPEIFQIMNPSILYYFILTGAPDSLDDETIPISSFQARYRSDASTYLSVVIPDGATWIDAVEARPNGELVIKMALATAGVIYQNDEILRVSLDADGIRYDAGSTSESITLVGHKVESFESPQTIELSDVVYRRQNGDGTITLRCAAPNIYLRPGDTAEYGDDSITVDTISYSISVSLQTVEVSGS
jgi:hypothetical protein